MNRRFFPMPRKRHTVLCCIAPCWTFGCCASPAGQSIGIHSRFGSSTNAVGWPEHWRIGCIIWRSTRRQISMSSTRSGFGETMMDFDSVTASSRSELGWITKHDMKSICLKYERPDQSPETTAAGACRSAVSGATRRSQICTFCAARIAQFFR